MQTSDERELRRAFQAMSLEEPPGRVHAGDIIFAARLRRERQRFRQLVAALVVLGVSAVPTSTVVMSMASNTSVGTSGRDLEVLASVPRSTHPQDVAAAEQARAKELAAAEDRRALEKAAAEKAAAETSMAAEAKVTYVSFLAKEDLDGRRTRDVDDRSFPDLYKRGQVVFVRCQQHGGEAYGSRIWNFTREKVWVPDAFVMTGTTSWAPGVPRCPASLDGAPGASSLAVTP